jgi:3-oxo-4-pregnene-20-carboxyl-CoA dehydrogenase alpha subunit
MKLELSPEALDYGRAVRDALAAARPIGPDDPGEAVEKTLAGLGAWDLDPRGDTDDLEAAAALCRAAGYSGTGYPVAERLAPAPDAGAIKAAADPAGARDAALGLTLPCWTLLGMADRAIDLTRGHVTVREQFGQALSKFQGVQFQLTDAEVERGGLDVLAGYTLWSAATGRPEALDDALALRAAALEAADVVFRVAHQLHGALGFCDEAPLSWLSRRSQPLRRKPFGLSATRALLTERIGRRGLTGLFDAEYTR